MRSRGSVAPSKLPRRTCKASIVCWLERLLAELHLRMLP